MTEQAMTEKDVYEAEQKLLDKENPKDLEILIEDGGWASETVDWDLGNYDQYLGMKKIFYIRNPNKLLTATLRAMEFSDTKWIFHGPKDNEILPLQTAKVSLEIPAIKEEPQTTKQFMDDIRTGKANKELVQKDKKDVRLEGIIMWSIRPTLKNLEKELRKKFEDGE